VHSGSRWFVDVIGVPELSGRLDEETFEVPDVNWTHWSPQSIILLTELSKLSNHNNNNNNLVLYEGLTG